MTNARRRALVAAGAISSSLTLLAACAGTDTTSVASTPSLSAGSAATGPATTGSATTAPAEEGNSGPSASPDASSGESPAEAGEPVGATPPPGLPTLGSGRLQTDVLTRLPGSPGFACVAVGTARDVRSGGFGAGPFDTARSQAEADAKTVRLYFIPEHSKQMPGVVVSARNAETGATFEKRQRNVADADQFRFYDLELPATSGTWQIKAQAGPDTGCWTVDLG